MRSQPAHGAAAILESGREGGLARKPVVDGSGNETARREVHDIARYALLPRCEAGFVAFQPAAAMNDQDPRPRLAVPVLFHRKVEFPLRARAFPIGEVVIDDDLFGSPRFLGPRP